jgi:hypothetical protein
LSSTMRKRSRLHSTLYITQLRRLMGDGFSSATMNGFG